MIGVWQATDTSCKACRSGAVGSLLWILAHLFLEFFDDFLKTVTDRSAENRTCRCEESAALQRDHRGLHRCPLGSCARAGVTLAPYLYLCSRSPACCFSLFSCTSRWCSVFCSSADCRKETARRERCSKYRTLQTETTISRDSNGHFNTVKSAFILLLIRVPVYNEWGEGRGGCSKLK